MRGRVHADDGVTVIEMLVTSFILGLGVMGVAFLLLSGARTASLVEVQRDATALATGELEIIRSLDYGYVGIVPTADGYRPEVDGFPTVTETEANLVEPIDKVRVDNVTFVIQRSVTWATIDRDERAYKIVKVIVEWETPSGQRSLTVQTGLHEGLIGV